MIITLLVVLIFVLGICMAIYSSVRPTSCLFEIIAYINLFLGGIGVFCVCFILILTHVGIDVTVEQNRLEYESLMDRANFAHSGFEDISEVTVMRDIAEWNKKVISVHYWADNPWTNWFWPRKVVDSYNLIEVNMAAKDTPFGLQGSED